jgi:ParB family chromosome partitioning protein
MKLNNPLERVRDVIHSGMGQPPAEGRIFAFINLDQLDPNPFQPRHSFDGEAMEDLCRSIEQHGVIEPIIVRRKEDRYEIISGERRWRACQKLGLEEIPCVLKNVSDAEAFKLALTENIQRNNLTPLEEAEAFRRLLDMKIARTQTEIGEILGIRQQRVSDKLRLLELPKDVQALFGDSRYHVRFTQKHGELVGRLPDAAMIQEAANKIVEEELSCRETRKLVLRMMKQKTLTGATPGRPPKLLHVSRNRHGFTLKLSYDRRRDSLEQALAELLHMAERLRKEFTPGEPAK